MNLPVSIRVIKLKNMSKTGPIILVEDDADDEEIFREALAEIGVENEIICFITTRETFDYLKKTTSQPFLIFCDVNLPGQSGLDFKKQVDHDPQLRQRSIPFIFNSTSVDKRTVTEAYRQLTIQGYFRKQHTYSDVLSTLRTIIEYWRCCEHPSSFQHLE